MVRPRLDRGSVGGGGTTDQPTNEPEQDSTTTRTGGLEPGAMTGPANIIGSAPAPALDVDTDPQPEIVAETGGNKPGPLDNPTPATVDVTQTNPVGPTTPISELPDAPTQNPAARIRRTFTAFDDIGLAAVIVAGLALLAGVVGAS